MGVQEGFLFAECWVGSRMHVSLCGKGGKHSVLCRMNRKKERKVCDLEGKEIVLMG